jgi:hypothetical protein
MVLRAAQVEEGEKCPPLQEVEVLWQAIDAKEWASYWELIEEGHAAVAELPWCWTSMRQSALMRCVVRGLVPGQLLERDWPA